MPPVSPAPKRDPHLTAVPALPAPRPPATAPPRPAPFSAPTRAHLTAVPPLEDRAAGSDACGLPGPEIRHIAAIAVHAFEALAGMRPVAQLGNAVTWRLATQLGRVRAARMERRSLTRDARHSTPRLGRVLTSRPTPHAVEAAVVLHTNRRTHAVAMRLEWIDDRWRATELTVL